VLSQVVAVQAPQADIQKIPFPEAPPIALHVLAEKQLRHFRAHRALVALALVHQELDFLGRHKGLGSDPGSGKAGYGAEMSAGAHYEARLDGSVGNPSVVRPLELSQGSFLEDTRA
jgi:hypothetical protein